MRNSLGMLEDLAEIRYIYEYRPHGVQRLIGIGSSAFIGELDDSTVLKYTLEPGGDRSRLETEYKLLQIVGPHPRIIGLRGLSDAGLRLERAVNGNLYDYFSKPDQPSPSLQQRLVWCRETAEAIVHVHSKNVIHCDIQPTNLLLDEDFHLKLSDFQGNYISNDGELILEGGSAEPCRFFCPRDDPFEADIKTDLFALGCTIYFIMMGHCVFPDIKDGEDGWYDQVQSRFANKQFPDDLQWCNAITWKCWTKRYDSAIDVLQDIRNCRNEIEQGNQSDKQKATLIEQLCMTKSGFRSLWLIEQLLRNCIASHLLM